MLGLKLTLLVKGAVLAGEGDVAEYSIIPPTLVRD